MVGITLSPELIDSMAHSLQGISDVELHQQLATTSHLDASHNGFSDSILSMIPEFLAYAELSEAVMAGSFVSPSCKSCCTNKD